MKRIVTHDGNFHVDEVFAVAALKSALAESVSIVRTRDEDAIKKADIVVDVGGEYNPQNRRFDHHQKEGAGERENGIPYASFGLIWKSYGAHIAGNETVADVIDAKLVSPIDAIDNGVMLQDGTSRFEGIYSYSISSLVNSFRPTWQEETDRDTVFRSLVKLATGVINREIAHAKAVDAAEDAVNQAYKEAEDKRIIVLDDDFPRTALRQKSEPLFVVYPKADKGEWRLRAVPEDGFDNRKDLPKKWAGKEGKQLQEATGVSDAVFCHRGRFMAVTKSKAGALKLANKAI